MYIEPTFVPNTKSIAWAAGLYEGEGNCVGLIKVGLNANVTQKDRWVLERLLELFGGQIHGPYKDGTSRWTLHSYYAAGFLMTIYTFLSPRRQAQIKQALNTWKTFKLATR